MTPEISDARVLEAVRGFNDPETGRDIVHMEQVDDISIDGSDVAVTLKLSTHSAPVWESTRAKLAERLQCNLPGVGNVKVNLARLDRPAQPLGEIGLHVKSVIAVGSGKGGVGKSTIAAAIAYGLRRAGAEVGLMDADVYGPSIPHLLGLEGRPEVIDKKIQPHDRDGIRVMSMGFLVPAEEAVIWRGPMLHGAITQFLRDTNWGNLDYLIIDMPPGTGDIALTLSQLLPLTGAVVVCTPQDVALLDATKAITMFRKVNIPILGIVENMSGFVCTDCGKQHNIFGKGGARERAEQLDVPFLGDLPINLRVRELGDAGKMGASFDDAQFGPLLDQLAFRLVDNLATDRAANPPLPTLNIL